MGNGQRQRAKQCRHPRHGPVEPQKKQGNGGGAKHGRDRIHDPQRIHIREKLNQRVAAHHVEGMVPGGHAQPRKRERVRRKVDVDNFGQNKGLGRDHFTLQSNAVAPGQPRLQGKQIEREHAHE